MASLSWILLIVGPMYVLAAAPQWKDLDIGDIRNNVHSALKMKMEKRNPEVNTLTEQWSKDLANCSTVITALQNTCKDCTRAKCTDKDFVNFVKNLPFHHQKRINDLDKLGKQIKVVIDSLFTSRRKRSVGKVMKKFTQNCFNTKCPSCKKVVGSNKNWFIISAVCGDDLLKRRSVLQWHGQTIGRLSGPLDYPGYGLTKVQVPVTFNFKDGSISEVQVTFKMDDKRSDSYQSNVASSSGTIKAFAKDIADEYWRRIGM